MNTWQTVKTKPISTTNMYQRQDTHTPQPADQTEVMTERGQIKEMISLSVQSGVKLVKILYIVHSDRNSNM